MLREKKFGVYIPFFFLSLIIYKRRSELVLLLLVGSTVCSLCRGHRIRTFACVLISLYTGERECSERARIYGRVSARERVQ